MRSFAAGDDVERIFSNFTRALPSVLAQCMRREPVPWESALVDVARLLTGAQIDWYLSGSAALAARRLAIEPRELDLVVGDAPRVADLLRVELIEPLSVNDAGTWIAQWFGRAFVGARVEWIGGVDPTIDEWASPNEFGPATAARLETVPCNDLEIRVPPLDVQLAVSERRGLDDRVAAIRRLSKRRADG